MSSDETATGSRPRDPDPLTAGERAELLRLARAAVGADLGLADTPDLGLPTAKLLESSGAFVTLHLDGELRGCIGTFEADAAPLYETVMRAARAAAFKDPRFPPLTAGEWRRVLFEISRLSPPQRSTPERVVAGIHGVHVAQGASRALLLPQVAQDHGWGRERLLREACRKAGLHEDAWLESETELSVFTAEVFGDEATAPS